MDKKSAEEILKAALAFDPHIDSILAKTLALPDGDEKESMVKAMGYVMSNLTLHIIFPIVKQYPELDPDK